MSDRTKQQALTAFSGHSRLRGRQRQSVNFFDEKKYITLSRRTLIHCNNVQYLTMCLILPKLLKYDPFFDGQISLQHFNGMRRD